MSGPGSELDRGDVLADILNAVERAAFADIIRWTDAAELLRLTERVLNGDRDREFEIAWHLWQQSVRDASSRSEPKRTRRHRSRHLQVGRVDPERPRKEVPQWRA